MDESELPSPPPPLHPLRWFPEFLELGSRRLRPQVRVLGLSLIVGLISGLGAIVFFAACQVVSRYSLDAIAGYQPAEPGGEQPLFGASTTPLTPWLLILVPAVGGLLSGLIVYRLAPEAEGHGTDAAIAAYHYHQGTIRPRVPLVKIVASAITLGTGGSGGREGPIAQIGAGFGSFLGGVLRLRPAERRILLAAGMGAGIAAIFRAPLAGALFAAEVLYRSPDFESEVIIPAALASVIAYCTFGAVYGWAPLFSLSPDVMLVLTFENPLHLIPYTLLALFLVVLAMVYTRSFYGTTYLFHKLPMPQSLKPAIGAGLSGLLGVGLFLLFGENEQLLSVLSFGYGVLQQAMTAPVDQPPTQAMGWILLAIALGKIATTSLTIGSGGSGGVFGPSMVIGGCGGGALGTLLHHAWPAAAPNPATFVIIGMAGFFAAAAKTPFSTLVMVSELTGNYNLLLPTLWVCALAFLLSDDQSIYSAQLESRSRSPAHQSEFVRGILSGITVEQFLTPGRPTLALHANDSLEAVLSRFGDSGRTILPVVADDNSYLGVIRLEEAYLALQLPSLGAVALATDLVRNDVLPLRPADSINYAMEQFAANDVLELPVVDAAEQRLVGIVSRAEIAGAYLRRMRVQNA